MHELAGLSMFKHHDRLSSVFSVYVPNCKISFNAPEMLLFNPNCRGCILAAIYYVVAAENRGSLLMLLVEPQVYLFLTTIQRLFLAATF